MNDITPLYLVCIAKSGLKMRKSAIHEMLQCFPRPVEFFIKSVYLVFTIPIEQEEEDF